jgi:flagellar basal-body rod protein FlgB
MSGLFSNSLLKLGAAAAAREQMQTVISSNIANADTPRYQSDQRTFSDFFQERLAAKSSLNPIKTHAAHLTGSNAQGLSMSIFKHASEEQRMDGNTVNVEKEMATLAENQLMYELNMKIIQGKLGNIANAIKEGGR